jgi:uncharacterized membrane protein SirB2
MTNLVPNLLMAAVFLTGVILVVQVGRSKGLGASWAALNGFTAVFIVLALGFAWLTRDRLNSEAWFAVAGLFVVAFTVVAKLLNRR